MFHFVAYTLVSKQRLRNKQQETAIVRHHKFETVKYGYESKGIRTQENYAGECQQHIQKTDPSSRQRERPQKQSRNCQRQINIWSQAPDGCFIPR
jgi:hypothetical protein